MEYPKTHTCRVPAFWTAPYTLIAGFWAVLALMYILWIFLDYLVVFSIVGPLFYLLLLFFAYPARIQCVIDKDGMQLISRQVKKHILFSEMTIGLNFYNVHVLLFRSGRKWFPLKFLSEAILYDLFAAMPPSVRVDINDTLGWYDKLSDSTKQDLYLEAKLAAAMFRYLGSDNLLKALLARQMLLSLTKQAPENVLALQNTEEVRDWKDWLAREYGEPIEAYAYKLERDCVKNALYWLVLPGLTLTALSLFFSEELSSVILAGNACFCLAMMTAIGIVLFRYKRIASEMRRWRANDDGTNTPRPENHNGEQLGDDK